MSVEKLSEEEISQIQILKSTGRTVIEEVISRVEETEKEEIWEKLIGQSLVSGIWEKLIGQPLVTGICKVGS